MAKSNILMIGIIVIIVLVVGMLFQKNYGLFAGVGSSITRTAPTTVNPSATFIVTYATSGAGTDKWFAAWADTVTGGCTPTVNNDFMGSETGGDKSTTKTFTAPSSGSCIFNGYYQFTGGSQTNFPALTVTVCSETCSSLGKQCGTWNVCGISQSCGTCGTGQLCSSSGTCLTCRTSADTNCDNIVTFSELNIYANQWVAGTVTFSNLIQAANAWASS